MPRLRRGVVVGEPVADAGRLMVAALGLGRMRQLAAMLAMVDVPMGARVLELGTDPDFGYSALLLARATRRGKVFSVHESAPLADRVCRFQRLWAPVLAGRVCFRTGPLAAGWAAGQFFDVVVSHSRFGWLPDAWLAQCAPGARIVLPLDNSIDGPDMFLCVVVDDGRRPSEPTVLIEREAHPHCSRYEQASAVELLPMDGGYSITTSV